MLTKKLSLSSAVLISINIMLGSGIFINTVILAKQAGALSPFIYALVAILILPLILSISKLMSLVKSGGTFYDFGLCINPYFAFLASWSYFIAKLATCALAINVCMILLQNIIPILQFIPTIILDLFAIACFTILNKFNMQLGKSVQIYFIIFKFVPILFAILTGLFLFNIKNLTTGNFIWSGISGSIPLVLYAFSGFEASCSLSNSIENHEKNGPKAILISYFSVIFIVVIYQLLFYASLGTGLSSLDGYQNSFYALLSKITLAGNLKNILVTILHIGIASSALGAAYGIMYSNSWNLYKLACNKHIPFKSIFTKLNKNGIPFNCILLEAFIVIVYTFLSINRQLPLQQISALGSAIAYTISSFALFIIYKKNRMLSLLSILSCTILLGSFAISIFNNGLSNLLIVFILILLIGSIIFFQKNHD